MIRSHAPLDLIVLRPGDIADPATETALALLAACWL